MTTYARKQFRGTLFEADQPSRNVELIADEVIASEVVETFTDGDSTPSVVVPTTVYKTANTGATTISDFDDGFTGQIITVLIDDANTTIDFTASGLIGNGGSDWSPASGDSMRCVYDGTDWYCQISAAGSGLNNVVEDTTPQLGGNLDVQANVINTSTVNGGITLTPNGTGNVTLGNFVFDGDQTVGAGQDNYVLTYDNGAGTIQLEVSGSGGLNDVVDDLTPQLGGNLDLNSKTINGTGTIGITGAITATSFGGITSANLVDKSASETITGAWIFSNAGSSFPAAGINTGNLANGVYPYISAVSTNNDFKVVFCNSNAETSGNAGLVRDAADTFAYNASSNTLKVTNIDMGDGTLDQPVLQDYSIQDPGEYTPTGTVQTLTYSDGPAFQVDLESVTGNITITLSGGPPTGTYGQIVVKVTQDSTVARTITWAGGTFRWAGGVAHVMNSTLNGFSIYTFETWDGGTSWWGAGEDYS